MPHWQPANSDLPASGVTPGTYGDGTNVAQVTVDGAGLVTAAANVPITGGGGGGGVLDYVPRNTDLTVTGSTAATATTLITGNAVTYDGATRIRIECGTPEVAILTAASEVFLVLWEGATNLCGLGSLGQAVTTTISCYGTVVFTPTAGVHTYTIKAWKTVAGSSVTIRGGATTGGGYAPSWYMISTV
jgi:hypothetical protein